MFWRQAIADCQRTYARGAARFGRHPAMAADGTGAVAAAVEEHQNAGWVRAGNHRPLARHPVKINRIQLDVIRDGPVSANLIQPRPPLRPADRSRFGAEEVPYGLDLATVYRFPHRPSDRTYRSI